MTGCKHDAMPNYQSRQLQTRKVLWVNLERLVGKLENLLSYFLKILPLLSMMLTNETIEQSFHIPQTMKSLGEEVISAGTCNLLCRNWGKRVNEAGFFGVVWSFAFGMKPCVSQHAYINQRTLHYLYFIASGHEHIQLLKFWSSRLNTRIWTKHKVIQRPSNEYLNLWSIMET